MLLFGGLVFSQTPDNPWRIFFGINSVDIYPAGGDPDDFFAPQAAGVIHTDFERGFI